jgi:hypothetical protein
MDSKKICRRLDDKFIELFAEIKTGMTAREDSRAFGAMIEHRITVAWPKITSNLGFQPLEIPGKRTIFDFGIKEGGYIIGIDVKTKDLDSKRYSDGGICAVGNLLKFLANDKGSFLIAEFGHNESKENSGLRDIEYIRVAPFDCLPDNCYRIENLGTGQVRLNYTINQIYDEIKWGRPVNAFFDHFTDLAIKHYERVSRDAKKRIDAINKFRANGYTHFAFSR